MELSKRMKNNACLVDQGSMAADIGCDHGYVSIFLVQERKCKKVIAMDIGKGPLSQAEKNIFAAGLQNKIQCRLSNGMEKLTPGEVDTVLVAGMGGRLMGSILTSHPDVTDSLKTLVLQPQWDYEYIRKLVVSLGFAIIKEVFVTEHGKPYIAMKCVRSIQDVVPYSKAEFCFGRMSVIENADEYRSYLSRQLEKNKRLMEKLSESTGVHAATRLEELKETVALIKEALNQ